VVSVAAGARVVASGLFFSLVARTAWLRGWRDVMGFTYLTVVVP
jgi:hypothetical protein